MKTKHFFITAVLAVVFLVSAGFANALSPMPVSNNSTLIAQLQAEIAQLTAQLQTLLAQQNNTQTWCHTFNTNLKYGDQGDDVSALVTVLYKEGLYNETVSTINEDVASAIVGFQEKYASEILTPGGLKHGTGFVGPATRKKLNSLYGCVAPTSGLPVVNASVTPYKGATFTLAWTATNATNCTVNTNPSDVNFAGSWSDKLATSGNFTVSPTVTTTYTITCYNLNGSDSASATAVMPASSCTSNWQCTWGPCINGYQNQKWVDQNNCGIPLENVGACPQLTVACSPSAQFTIIYPTTGINLQVGRTYNITWTGGDPSVPNYAVYLVGGPLASNVSTFLGTAYPRGAGDAGTFTWTIPSTIQPANNYQIQFSAKGASGGNSASFNIVSATPQPSNILYKTDFDGGRLTTTLYRSDDGGNTWNNILTAYKSDIVYSVYSKNLDIIYAGNTSCNTMADTSKMCADLFKSTDGGNNWTSISKGIMNQIGVISGVSSLTVNQSNPNNVTLTVNAISLGSNSVNFQSTDGGITWVELGSTQPAITVTSPNGGEQLVKGTTHSITWTTSNIPSSDRVMIDLLSYNINDLSHPSAYFLTGPVAGGSANLSASGVPANSGSFTWVVSSGNGTDPFPFAPGNYFRVQVYDANNTNVYGTSSSYFSIVAP